ncbi:hypothetical protein M426DRAFT_237391 [Hypoxylon sp. CI-4A]|nr:hypothetical protein M426DRAFT_237391 [Hypoxylon sp. CI-4A]
MAMDMSDSSDSHTNTSMGEMEMDDSQMVMTFFFSYTTSLFSKSWTPTNPAQYAGTCIFLIVLAITMRVMLVLKPILERSLWNAAVEPGGELIPDDEAGFQKGEIIRPHIKRVYSAVIRRWAAWRFRTSLSRAIFELLLATVGYLL